MINKGIYQNYKYIYLDQRNNRHMFLQDEESLTKLLDDGFIKDGDIVLTITKENLQTAKLINHIELS